MYSLVTETFINTATTSHKITICENRTEETSAKTYGKSAAASLYVIDAISGPGAEGRELHTPLAFAYLQTM